ncbi:hypothetical protein GCM10007049_28410 [Echinicola pacifica]|uniref:Bacterial surface antigen (D15) domain-containing protein n=1 Tax=Echinicola pacifica TaxID=346377 RepID=A0A918Q406_9BACT|nr:hypothetical protein GCM10007049_28410 [Echinicola pacifica]
MKIPFLFLSLLFTASLSSAQELSQRLYLVGDAGQLDPNGLHPVVEQLRRMIAEEPDGLHSEVIYLGDNIYPKGMPEAGDPSELESQMVLLQQLSLSKEIEGEILMIPGNHDWKKGQADGLKAVLRAQAFIDSLSLTNVRWVPQDGCPGPITRQLNDHTILVAIDSQWWLQRENRPGEDSDCEYKTEEELIAALKDIVQENLDQTIILAMHHPLRTYGEHNGGYTWKDHLFPLTALNPDLYIPLPIIGSIYPLYRTYLGNIQDVPHPKYQEYIEQMQAAVEGHPAIIMVSGHEHALEYTMDNGIHHIVSGAGSKNTYLRKDNPAQFSISAKGFATIDLWSDGSTEMHFFQLGSPEPIFSNALSTAPAAITRTEASTGPALPDSVNQPISDQYGASVFQEKLYGANYREEWMQSVDLRVLKLDSERGGLSIIKRGGGMQTKSLRLVDSLGVEYVLRSVEKYPEAAIPKMLRHTMAKDIVQDQISASFPFGALLIPELAQAVGVVHTKPELVWLADDPGLGIYMEEFANAVYLYEEREVAPEKIDEEDYKYYSTDKMLRKIHEDQDFVIAQKKVLRARLLDLLIGDWDRHDDQWRWIGEETKDGREFIPMPRDRDQAFFVNEGIIPQIASRKWIMPKFQGFGYDIRDVNSFMFNGRYFDRSFLNDLDREDWEEVIDEFLADLDDRTIQSTVESLPATVYPYHGDEIIAKLLYRKSWLKDQALQYYDFISREVDIVGSYKSDKIEVRHEPDGKVDVEFKKISKKGAVQQKYFNRKFDPAVTQEVRLYGLGGEDDIEVTGEGPGLIKVRIMSGLEPDTIRDKSTLDQPANLIYQWREQEDVLDLGSSSTSILSKSSSVYDYDRKSFKYDLIMPLISLEYNIDDGLFLGGGVQWTKHGFRKDPYALQQSIKANYALKTKSFNIYYQGHATNLYNKWGLEWEAIMHAPNYVNNFFGYGNNITSFDKEEYGPKYYRVRYNQFMVNTWARRDLSENMVFKIGPVFQRTRMDEDDNEDKYINSPDQTDVDINDLNHPKFYGGLDMRFEVDETDNKHMPNRGLRFYNQLTHLAGLNANSHSTTQWNSEVSFYWSRQIPSIITWATRFGGGVTWGEYEFFQAQTLGGLDNLRGYRRKRYAGNSMIYNNTEARIRFRDFQTRLFPASTGLVVFHDIGRVWYAPEDSHKWHNSLGVGVWLAPLNSLVVSGDLAFGQEETLFTFNFGYQF